MELDGDTCYRILQARDARFDGAFFAAVTTTGIYCRPVCPARTPKRVHVRFYPCAASAEADGFRPCRRCRPETAPGTPAWNGTATTVSAALRLIAAGFLDSHSVSEMAGVLGMGDRQVRRLFEARLGAAPAAVARSRRAHFAARILQETGLPVSQVALSAGFGSIRQFNEVFRSVFGRSPSQARAAVRRMQPRGEARPITLTLSYRPPLAWPHLLSFLRVRAVRGVEEVTDRSYRRSIAVGGAVGTLDVCPGEGAALRVSLAGLDASTLDEAVRRVRRMFDLDADPRTVAAHLERDARLRPLVRGLPGLRIPATWDPFEALVRAVLGQQVSVAGAVTIVGRLAERAGRRVDGGGTITHVFPGPADLLHANLDGLGAPEARLRTLVAASQAILQGTVRFDGYAPPDVLLAGLTSIAGIGPWTSQYVALRGFGMPDAFPESDLGIRRALDERNYPRDAARRRQQVAALSPWRGYAALYLWSTLSAGARRE